MMLWKLSCIDIVLKMWGFGYLLFGDKKFGLGGVESCYWDLGTEWMGRIWRQGFGWLDTLDGNSTPQHVNFGKLAICFPLSYSEMSHFETLKLGQPAAGRPRGLAQWHCPGPHPEAHRGVPL